MKQIGFVILCRYNSSRLPGKILKSIEGKLIIQYIIERLNVVVAKENILIATSNEPTDDVIEKFAIENHLNIYRGGLKNVARRFFESSLDKDWEYIARINGDNVFLDINLLKKMIQITNENDFDFISNVKERTFPKGMSIEIVKKKYFEKLLPKIDKNEFYYEHVTSYLYENDVNDNFHYVFNQILPEAAGIQMALDTQKDFNRTELIIQNMKKNHTHYNLQELYYLYEKLKKNETNI